MRRWSRHDRRVSNLAPDERQQSIADFFYLIRALFMSRESLERENVEMRRRIATIEAEAAQANIEDDDEFQP